MESSSRRRPTVTPRSVFASGALLLVGGLLSLAAGEGAARVWAPQWRDFSSERFMTVAAVPGQGAVLIGRPGFDGWFAQNNGDFRVRIRINGFGAREPEPPEAATGRIWIVGDSFSFGWGVEEAETYASVLGRLTGVSTYNLASPGTDVCGYQRLVRRVPRGIAPRLVVVGLTLDNDIAEYANACAESKTAAVSVPGSRRALSLRDAKEWATHHSALYNFATVTLKRNPTAVRWLTAVGLIQPIALDRIGAPTGNAARAAALATARETSRIAEILPPGTPLVVLIIPSRFEVLAKDAAWKTLRELAVAALVARGVTVTDPTADLVAGGTAGLYFSNDGHWTPGAHAAAGRILARTVAPAMR